MISNLFLRFPEKPFPTKGHPIEPRVWPSLYNQQDERVFDSVVVITDRVVLDRQLQNTICQFDHRQGVVQKVDEDSRQLAEALEAGCRLSSPLCRNSPLSPDS